MDKDIRNMIQGYNLLVIRIACIKRDNQSEDHQLQ